eukprot:101174_1
MIPKDLLNNIEGDEIIDKLNYVMSQVNDINDIELYFPEIKKLFPTLNVNDSKELLKKVKHLISMPHFNNNTFVYQEFEPVLQWGTGTNMDIVYHSYGKFVKYPISETKAKEFGWKLFVDTCKDENVNNVFGKLYYKDNDVSTILIYNNYNKTITYKLCD